MTENDLSSEEKASLQAFRADLRSRISSWADLYSHLHTLVRTFRERPDPSSVSDAIYMHHAFVLALEDLPEEGDVLAILDRMAFVLMFDPARLGTRLHYGLPPGVQVVVIDKEALAALAQAGDASFQTQEGGPTSADDNGPKKILH